MFGNLKNKNFSLFLSLAFFVFVFLGGSFFSPLPANSQRDPTEPVVTVDCALNGACDLGCGRDGYPVDLDCAAGAPPPAATCGDDTPDACLANCAPLVDPDCGTTPPPDTSPPPDSSAAAPTGSGYQLLAPFPGVEEQSPGLTVYLRAVFSVALGLAVVLAVLMIVIGGIQYMGSESIFSHEEAKARITAAVLGLLLAFLSWVILQTINPKLLYVGLNVPEIQLEGAQGNQSPSGPTVAQCTSGTETPGGWFFTYLLGEEPKKDCFGDQGSCTATQELRSESSVASQISACQQFPTPPQERWCFLGNGGVPVCADSESACNVERESYPPPPPGPCTREGAPATYQGCPATAAEYTAGDNAIRTELGGSGGVVDVKSNNCTTCGQSGCTSVYGLPSAAVSALKRLKQACDGSFAGIGVCSIVVTGGTEAGHTEHGIGKPIFDLGLSDNVCRYFSGGSCESVNHTKDGVHCEYHRLRDPHLHCNI